MNEDLYDSQGVNCNTADFPLFLSMEFGVKSFPGLLFLFCGTYRYFSMRHMAKSSVRKTKLFKVKVFLNALMAVVCLLYCVVVFATPPQINLSSWINQCDKEYYSLIYLVQTLAWTVSCWLMTFEYERLLSEAWYANQLFWALNLVAEFATVVVLRTDILGSIFMMFTASFNVAVNFALVVMMLSTKRRTADNLRLNLEGEYLLANAIADMRSPQVTDRQQ